MIATVALPGVPEPMLDEDKTKEELLSELTSLRERLQRLAPAADGAAGEGREPRLRVLLDHSPDIITVLDLEGHLLYVNRGAPGTPLSDILGNRATDYMPAEEQRKFLLALARAVETRETQRLDVVGNAGLAWETRLVPLLEAGRVFAVMGIGTEITLRLRAAQALRESEEKLRLAVSATGVGLWKWDASSQQLTWDGASAALLDLPPAALPTLFSEYTAYVHPEERSRVKRIVEHSIGERAWRDLEHRVVTPSGQVRTLVLTGSVLLSEAGELQGFLGGLFDTTARKQLEEQLRQAQKMEALGQLTAGIAHNFNNMLTVILSNVHLLLAGAGSTQVPRLNDVEHAARRAADMVRELMVFGRRYPVARKRPVDVREAVRRTAEMCRTTFDKRIQLSVVVPDVALPVLADPGQLEQVLLNICLNARDAFEGQNNPHPTISLAAGTRRVGAAQQVCVTIRDNGPGMPEGVRSRIFEPFFTTKEVGRGTGLGLATAYGIVTDHGGEIECASRPGEGTEFIVAVPHASASSDSQTAFSAISGSTDG